MKKKRSDEIQGFARAAHDPRFAHLAKLDAAIREHWEPNEFQIEVGASVIYGGKRRIFVEVGRKGGKTEISSYLCWIMGNMIQNGQIYYFGAYAKAVREFLWAPNRLQGFGPSEYIRDINKTEMRLTFNTGTFVKLDGADEFKISKGFNPDMVICDEFADYSDEFWHAMSPNFAAKDAIVVCVSTPPWLLEKSPGEPVLFVRLADLWKKRMEDAEREGKWSKFVYFNFPSHVNEKNLPAGFLEQERQDLIDLGEEDLYVREYLARRVVGGGKRLVGTYDPERHKKPYDWMMERFSKDVSSVLYLTTCDPGNSSVFAALLTVINPYTKEIFFLDEIYEKQEDETMALSIQPRLSAKEKEIYPFDDDPWIRTYDEAAKWWYLDVMQHFQLTYNPTEKSLHTIEMGLSILRTAFRYDKAYISDRCVWFEWELLNWRKDSKGAVPRKNNHLVDAGRYTIHAADYFIKPEDRPEKPVLHIREQRRTIPLEEDLQTTFDDPNEFFGNPLDDMILPDDNRWN